MIERVVAELGPWNWMVLGCVLLALEIVVPGFFLLWIGIAALVTGALSLLLWDAGYWMWQVQVVVFLVLAVASAYAGNRLMRGRGGDSDMPLLNRRSEQMIGKVATLTEPIKDGRGRIRIGDTMWRVSGPDLPAGTQVRVKSAVATDLELIVETGRDSGSRGGLRRADPQQIVEMDDADRHVAVDDDQRADVVIVEQAHRRAGQRLPLHRLGLARHDVLDRKLRHVAMEVAGEVAVGDDADQPPCPVDDADAAEALPGQHHHRFRHLRAERHDRHFVAAVHDLADMGEVGAELAARDGRCGNDRP